MMFSTGGSPVSSTPNFSRSDGPERAVWPCANPIQSYGVNIEFLDERPQGEKRKAESGNTRTDRGCVRRTSRNMDEDGVSVGRPKGVEACGHAAARATPIAAVRFMVFQCASESWRCLLSMNLPSGSSRRQEAHSFAAHPEKIARLPRTRRRTRMRMIGSWPQCACISR